MTIGYRGRDGHGCGFPESPVEVPHNNALKLPVRPVTALAAQRLVLTKKLMERFRGELQLLGRTQ